MLGYGRVIRGGELAGFEYLRLIERDQGLWFIAQPGGGEATAFRAEVIESDFVRFVNPDHDYPRVIEYRHEDDRLTASIGDGLSVEASVAVSRFRFVLRDD